MQIAARHLDKITIFDISGDIDLATSPQLRKALLHEFRELKMPRVVLNLGGVRYRQRGAQVHCRSHIV